MDLIRQVGAKWCVYSTDGRQLVAYEGEGAEERARKYAAAVEAAQAKRQAGRTDGKQVVFRTDFDSALPETEAPIRTDRVALTPQGGVRVSAKIARTGIQIYHDIDGNEIREYRPPEEVFADEALASFADATVTHLHPFEGYVGPDNWAFEAIGHVSGTPKKSGRKYVAADLVVQKPSAVGAIARGEIHDVSCGYMVVMDYTPGTTPEGEDYDAMQTEIRGNHVALGPRDWGRAGSEVAIERDGKDSHMTTAEDIRKAVQDALAEHQAALVAERKRADEAQAKADAAAAALAKAEAASAPATLDAAVKDGVAFERDLAAVLSAEQIAKLDGRPRAEREAAAILAVWPDTKLDGKSDDYRRATFDLAVKQAARAAASLEAARNGSGRADGPAVVSDYEALKAQGFAAFGRK